MKPQRPAILTPLKFPYKLYNLPHITVMLDMTSNSPTCLISEKTKQQETVSQISYNNFSPRFLPYIGFCNVNLLY
jgi:hypothetical protein